MLAASKQCFDHKLKLSKYTQPLLVMHTEHDGLVDISHAERNFSRAASTIKELVRFPAGNHNTILAVNATKYLDAIRKFAGSI